MIRVDQTTDVPKGAIQLNLFSKFVIFFLFLSITYFLNIYPGYGKKMHMESNAVRIIRMCVVLGQYRPRQYEYDSMK